MKRAIAVRDYLIGQGIAASATDVAGLGASKPIADNATADGRARNRRVEIVISGPPLLSRRAPPSDPLQRRLERVLHQDRDRHGADATGNGRDPARALASRLKVHVAD